MAANPEFQNQQPIRGVPQPTPTNPQSSPTFNNNLNNIFKRNPNDYNPNVNPPAYRTTCTKDTPHCCANDTNSFPCNQSDCAMYSGLGAGYTCGKGIIDSWFSPTVRPTTNPIVFNPNQGGVFNQGGTVVNQASPLINSEECIITCPTGHCLNGVCMSERVNSPSLTTGGQVLAGVVVVGIIVLLGVFIIRM